MSKNLEEATKKFAAEDFKFREEAADKILADCDTEGEEMVVENKPNVYAITGISPRVGDVVVSVWQYDRGSVNTTAYDVVEVHSDHIAVTQKESNPDYGYPRDSLASKFYFIKRAEDRYVPNY